MNNNKIEKIYRDSINGEKEKIIIKISGRGWKTIELSEFIFMALDENFYYKYNLDCEELTEENQTIIINEIINYYKLNKKLKNFFYDYADLYKFLIDGNNYKLFCELDENEILFNNYINIFNNILKECFYSSELSIIEYYKRKNKRK